MKLNEIKRIVREEVISSFRKTVGTRQQKRNLQENITRKHFIAMAKLIRLAGASDREKLTKFAVAFFKAENPRFNEAIFRDAVKKPGKL